MPVAKFTKGEKPSQAAIVEKLVEMAKCLKKGFGMGYQLGDNSHPDAVVWRIYPSDDMNDMLYSGSIPTASHNKANVPAALSVINGAINWINGGCK